MNSQSVYFVDDDASIRDALKSFLDLSGVPTQVFSSGDEFLAKLQPHYNGCVLLDLKMPGLNGLQVHQELVNRDSLLPVIIMTAHGDVSTVRNALKAGAYDFLEKPVENSILLDVVRSALDFAASRRRRFLEQSDMESKVARLTGREREVMRHLALGRQFRDIASILGISPRTVEVYKARMMEKLGTRSLADVIHIASKLSDESAATD
ncbi:MAG: response regulator [Ferrovibrio sp.]|uniref:response regulator transcription factor n=1 Tax=Ferrovibrio sp. TaxID=1917215 RepID=UPI002634078C|nr:response regulator [Ferrovibrio sp.]MCW0235756.1 response regulator [Ferrovibrio sp.]